MLTVAMETMHFFNSAKEFIFEDIFLCISRVLMNDLAPMKNCPGVQGRSN